MDYLETGKKLAQDGHYEDALEKLSLALENDKENPDIHFFIGLCYSSLEEFAYAKYHYQIALSLDPEHPKTKLMWDGIKSVEAKKPPERNITRKAAANERRQQKAENKAIYHDSMPKQPDPDLEESRQEADEERSEYVSPGEERHYKVTDSKWEQAFPAEELVKEKEESGGFFLKFILFLVGFAIVAGIIFFIYKTLQ